MNMNLASILLVDCETSIDEQIKNIEEQAKIKDSVLIDHVEKVCVWEMVEFKFSCKEFLKLIE